MNLLTLKKGNKRYDLQINNIKYCIGNDFEEKYNDFLQILENEINTYARTHHEIPKNHSFEDIDSIFERSYAIAS